MQPTRIIPLFDAFLASRGHRLEAIATGGAALALLGIIHRETRDCDLIEPELPAAVRSAAMDFAADLRKQGEILRDDWLRVPNKTPTWPREGRRASEARNARRRVAGTTRDERDAASRRPPALARREKARWAPRGVTALERCPASPCGPFLAVHPTWLSRDLVGVLLGTLNNGPSALGPLLPEGWRTRLQVLYQGQAIHLWSLGRPELLLAKLWALCDRGLDLADCLALAPDASELIGAETWIVEQDLNPEWPAHVRATLSDVARRLGHGL